MKRRIWLVAGIMVMAMCGCYVQSLNRFYTEKNKIALAGVNGDWFSRVQLGESVSGKKITPWRFTPKTITTYDKENVCSILEVVYFKAGKNIFIDVTAGTPLRSENIFWHSGIIPAHTVCKLELKDGTMTIVPLSIKWVKSKLDNNQLKLKYVKAEDKDGNYVFTSTPEEWEKFLSEYGSDREAFNPDGAFVFSRIAGEN